MTKHSKKPALILASASVARAQLLSAAGVDFEVCPSGIDEDAIKAQHQGDAETLARALAQAKSEKIAAVRDTALVLAADQLLVFEEQRFDKPNTRNDARAQLLQLRGKSHMLVNGTCLNLGGRVVWAHSERVVLTMRDFSDAFLDAYLDAEGDAVLKSVGGYRLEGLGAQFFTQIEGGYFSVLGLPLLPILDALRQFGVVSE